jgi:dTMP kinase
MIKNSYPGKFIVFEGLDGSGQSTQVSFLRDFLILKGIGVVATKEPTIDSDAGKKIRQILDEKEKADPKILQELFVQDRQEHLDNVIFPALKEGKFVISDRYFFSTFAFGASDGLDLEWLIKMNDNFLLPDQTFILNTSPETCVRRIEQRGIPVTLFEKKEKLSRVWKTYAIMPDRFENTLIIDGEGTKDEVFKNVKKIITEKFLI